MIDVRPTRESEVVLAFLRTEIDYSSHRQEIQQYFQGLGVTRHELLDGSNMNNDYYNALRAVVFDCYRGYLRRTALFSGFPRDVNWRLVELESPDFGHLKYVRSAEWEPLSEGTRQPQRVIDRIARGELPELAQKVFAIQERLQSGEILPELAAVEGEGSNLLLIEGAPLGG
jgi:hypothetical protein